MAEAEQLLQIFLFDVSKRRYAIPVSCMREVILAMTILHLVKFESKTKDLILMMMSLC